MKIGEIRGGFFAFKLLCKFDEKQIVIHQVVKLITGLYTSSDVPFCRNQIVMTLTLMVTDFVSISELLR